MGGETRPMSTTPHADTPDTEITLTRGDLRLVVAPYGASLRGLSRVSGTGQAEPIIAGYEGAANKIGGQGDVLIPFPGRVAEGRYTFAGQAYQMQKNDKEGPNAIHGFLRQIIWDTEAADADSVTFTTAFAADAHAGYPFALSARVSYTLTGDGLACAFSVTNTGDAPAPVGAGFHPYFTAGAGLIDADTLEVPFETFLEFDAGLIPTGRVLPVAGTPVDFLAPRALGATVFNTCYARPRRGADGRACVRLSDGQTGRALSVWMDAAFDYVVLYSGDPLPPDHSRRALAVEPMTCGADAFNHPEWGLTTLAPGATLSGAWGVTVA